jgi:hypothetical protein
MKLTAIFLTIVVALTSSMVWGQSISTAQITGTVVDTSGSAVPDAQITATQTATGLVRTTTSAADGGYSLTNLPVGPYRVEVAKDGFAKYIQEGIVLQVGSDSTVEVAMKVGTLSEQVEVQANASLVETQNAGVGEVIDSQRVLELPLNGRQATDLIFLGGMATPAAGTPSSQPGGSGINAGTKNYPTQAISVAGGITNGLTYTLDGATHNDPYNNLNLPLPFPDALQEFKVETSALPAQYGQHSSAAINGITRSGSNAFHGDAFEFLRNGDVNARNAFAPVPDPLKRNQFGGTFGGPILKNKLFFFIGEQTTLQRDVKNGNIAYVPNEQMIQGNFTGITSPQCNTSGKQINLPAPFVNNTIAPSLLSPVAMAIVNMPGFPQVNNTCGQVVYGTLQNSNEDIGLARVDYQKSDKHSLFFRYFAAHLLQPTDTASNPDDKLLGSDVATLNFLVQSAVLGDTYLIGTGTVNNFRATLNRTDIPKYNADLLDASTVGIDAWVGVPGYLRMTTTNGFTIGGSNGTPSVYNTVAFQFADDVSLIRGKHQFAFGMNFIRSYFNASSAIYASGAFTFSGQVTGLGLADFMLGKPASFQDGAEDLDYTRMNYLGVYAQDSWRILPRLTINYGVRWEPYLAPTAKDGWVYNFSPALFAEGYHTSQYTNAPDGIIYPGDPGYPSGDKVANNRYNNFAPRVSLAWDPKGDGKMSIRAAYGMFYDMPSHNDFLEFAFSPPFGSATTVNFPSSFAQPWSGVPGGNPFPQPAITKDSPFVAFGQYENFLLNPKTPYSEQWNVSIQREFGSNWLVEANYVGDAFMHLEGGDQANPGVYIPGSCTINGAPANPCSTSGNVNYRRALYLQNPVQGQYFGAINQLDAGGTGSYNALVLTAKHRLSEGFTVLGAYTWSHCIATMANIELGGSGVDFMIPNDRDRDRGNCPGSDRRQQLNLSIVYETPKFSERWLRSVASGWQYSTILQVITGPYINVLSGLDNAESGQTSVERPNQVLSNPYCANRSLSCYLNPAAFAQPAIGTYGDLGNYAILAPGGIFLDMGLVRNFYVREKQSIQLRFEAFNVPNHLNPGTPTGVSGTAGIYTPTVALNNPNFGRILSAQDPRIFQIAAKFVF